jgi:hypothetical protein
MKTDAEELLRDGMERFTTGVRAPDGLAGTVARMHRRRRMTRTAVACGTAAVTAAAVALVMVTGGTAGSGVSPAQAKEMAYVTTRVENALASENLVFVGRADSKMGDYVTWAYGPRYRWEALAGSEPYWVQGTALVGGKLVGAYVTYFDHRYSLWPLGPQPSSACSTNAALSMGAPVIPTTHWSGFINSTLACGAASVTGRVKINGMETIRITGKPITVRLSPGYAKLVHEKRATARWTLYVDPKTYLPVRMDGSTETFGGGGSNFTSAFVTNVRWLAPTPANIAQALVTIPPGFHHYTGLSGNQ